VITALKFYAAVAMATVSVMKKECVNAISDILAQTVMNKFALEDVGLEYVLKENVYVPTF
jgi:hypothetical protein